VKIESITSICRHAVLKISLALFFVLVAFGVVQTFLAAYFFDQVAANSSQQLHYHVAENIANFVQDELHPNVKQDLVKEKLALVRKLNPEIAIYILNKHGIIQEQYLPEGYHGQIFVRTDPIKTFLNSSESELPVLGENPIDPEIQSPFSAARIKIEFEPAYIYAVFKGSQIAVAATQVRSSEVARTLLSLLAICGITALCITIILFLFMANRYRVLTDIVAHISHDLRSPLGTVRNYLETLLLKENTLSDEQRRKFVTIALRHTAKLSSLLHDLLEIADIRQLHQRLDLKPFQPVEVCTTVLDQYLDYAKQRGVKLRFKYSENLPLAYGDARSIERVLSNLVENGIRYTPDGGDVVLSVQQGHSGIQFKVQDSGIGITKQDQKRIFKKFYRGKDASNKEPRGSGLGLALVSEIIKGHGSRIELSSFPKMGSTFSFLLPVAVKNPGRVRRPVAAAPSRARMVG
jgi:signal transduction histidine kinase